MTTITDPLIAARALRTTIKTARHEIEAARCLPASIVDKLIETGLCRLTVPESLGGREAEPLVGFDVYEELASADASVAWIAWNNALPGLLSRYLSNAVRAELFADSHRLFASSTRPSGRAVMQPGGFRVSGRWSLVSGCELADWIPLMCVITTDEGEQRMQAAGVPEMRMAYVPKGSYNILDTWHVGGLRGTGSHDVVVDDIFVPSELTFSLEDPNHIDRPLYWMPLMATLGAWCAAICLGIAREANDTLLDLGSSKLPVDPGPGLRDRQVVQAMVASSTAALEAARLLLRDALGDLWTACSRGTPVTDIQRARMWGSTIHAARTAKTTVTSMYEAAGASALYIDCPIERAHRDIHAVMQHVILQHIWLEQAGRIRLGLKPTHPLF
jgi:alkylation response protein AidB-like acyl-CoA dehydrogenase